jgi:hypothetical protein
MTVAQNAKPQRIQALVSSHRVVIYFAATFAISWAGAFAVAASTFLRDGSISKITG